MAGKNGYVLCGWAVVCLFASGCCRLGGEASCPAPVVNRALEVENFAAGSYDRAVVYLRQGRYELARDQFAVVVATSESPLLRRLAGEGLAKSEQVVVGRR